MISWKGRTVLVTGAGTGMGLEMTRRLSRAGASVIMTARNEDRLRSLSAELPGTSVYAADLSSVDDIARLVEHLRTEHPSVDAAVLNAGVTHTYRLFRKEDMRSRAELEMVTNYFSAISLVQGLVPLLSSNAHPLLVITTSGVVYGPDITNPTYSASKAALHSLTQSVRLQLERDGSPLRVVEFLAPLVDSPFAAGVQSDSKMSVEDAIELMLDALDTDEVELRVGAAEEIYRTLARSSDEAVRLVNAATGG